MKALTIKQPWAHAMRDVHGNLWFNPDFVAKRRAATSIKLASDRTAHKISAT